MIDVWVLAMLSTVPATKKKARCERITFFVVVFFFEKEMKKGSRMEKQQARILSFRRLRLFSERE